MPNNLVKFRKGTLANYDSIGHKDPNTLYFIEDVDTSEGLYLGDQLIANKIVTVDLTTPTSDGGLGVNATHAGKLIQGNANDDCLSPSTPTCEVLGKTGTYKVIYNIAKDFCFVHVNTEELTGSTKVCTQKFISLIGDDLNQRINHTYQRQLYKPDGEGWQYYKPSDELSDIPNSLGWYRVADGVAKGKDSFSEISESNKVIKLTLTRNNDTPENTPEDIGTAYIKNFKPTPFTSTEFENLSQENKLLILSYINGTATGSDTNLYSHKDLISVYERVQAAQIDDNGFISIEPVGISQTTSFYISEYELVDLVKYSSEILATEKGVVEFLRNLNLTGGSGGGATYTGVNDISISSTNEISTTVGDGFTALVNVGGVSAGDTFGLRPADPDNPEDLGDPKTLLGVIKKILCPDLYPDENPINPTLASIPTSITFDLGQDFTTGGHSLSEKISRLTLTDGRLNTYTWSASNGFNQKSVLAGCLPEVGGDSFKFQVDSGSIFEAAMVDTPAKQENNDISYYEFEYSDDDSTGFRDFIDSINTSSTSNLPSYNTYKTKTNKSYRFTSHNLTFSIPYTASSSACKAVIGGALSPITDSETLASRVVPAGDAKCNITVDWRCPIFIGYIKHQKLEDSFNQAIEDVLANPENNENDINYYTDPSQESSKPLSKREYINISRIGNKTYNVYGFVDNDRFRGYNGAGNNTNLLIVIPADYSIQTFFNDDTKESYITNGDIISEYITVKNPSYEELEYAVYRMQFDSIPPANKYVITIKR